MTRLITVLGIVQGVGYRPFAARLAEELSLPGTIMNCGGIVQIVINPPSEEVFTQFVRRLKTDQPPGAFVLDIRTRTLPDQEFEGFRILPSAGMIDPEDSSEEGNPSFIVNDNPFPLETIENGKPSIEEGKPSYQEKDNASFEHLSGQGAGQGDGSSVLRQKNRPPVLKTGRGIEHPLIPADLPLCDACKQEMADPENRRYLYPFISCVACGPRYSIIKELPYDRDTVTMDVFPMCPACQKEYTENQNRRRHAQTISCHDCGPSLILDYHGKVLHKHAALLKSVVLLQQGNVLAVKGIGGYQYVCLPSDPQAVDQLRLLKQRDKKPFAVMFPNLASIRNFCEVSAGEEMLLLSPARPIVLLDKKKRKDFYDGVCGESRQIGAFLPYTPLHQLLTQACGPLVMTSANLTSDPILYNDDEMLALQSPCLAGVLYNERRITTPLDDSVVRFVPDAYPENKTRGRTGGRFFCLKTEEPSPCPASETPETPGSNGEGKNPGTSQVIRRSRGYVPVPVLLAQDCATPVLAMGGDLKSAFCLYHHQRAYISQYFGDMENARVSEVYEKNLSRMESLFGITPGIIVRDLHPRYFSAILAEQLAERLPPASPVPLLSVQHHHAHAASVMAEHGLSSCIGVVFDGTGYGTDGAIWGGEFLICKEERFERRAHLGYVTLAGGDAVARYAELAAQCYLIAAEAEDAIAVKVTETTKTKVNVPEEVKEKSESVSIEINPVKNIKIRDIKGMEINDGNNIEPKTETANEAEAAKAEMKDIDLLRSAIEHQINTSKSSSMGRLFDAVSAILEIRQENTFEGECAIALENAAWKFAETGVMKPCDSLHFKIIEDPRAEILIDQIDMFRQIAAKAEAIAAIETGPLHRGHLTGAVSYAFHQAIAEMITSVCTALRAASGENSVVLSGGVFANRLLLQSAMAMLREERFDVFINSEVPANDGGICLGQAWIAGQTIAHQTSEASIKDKTH